MSRSRAADSLLAITLIGSLSAANAQVQRGVSKTEVLLGTIQDLSGPIAAFGNETRNGMNMRIDEVNAAGGVNGRKIRLIVEDSGYDTKRAMMAAQKLADSDRVFAAVGSIGTAIALTTQQVFTDAGVINAFPVAAARGLYEPVHPLKFAFAVPYYQQGQVIVKALNGKRADRKWCSLVQDDDLGNELMQGANAGMKDIGKTMLERTTYKRGATDFSSQVARLKGADCDTVVLGTTLRETIGTLNEAKKLGFTPQFVGMSATYSHLMAKLGGSVTEGLLASHATTQPYADEGSKATRDWFQSYKTKYKEEPGQYAVFGYAAIDWTLKTIEKVGPNLTTAGFTETLENMTFPRDKLGFDAMSYSKTKHLGSDTVRLSQMTNGKWVPITDFIKP